MYSLLIVDDEAKERNGLKKLIQRFDYPFKVFLAENGERALEIMDKECIDIVLTDIKMPYMSGINMIRHIRERNLQPVIIIYSAYGEFEYAQEAITLGVMKYLLKPIRIDEFRNLFDEVLSMCEEKQKSRKKESDRLLYERKEQIGNALHALIAGDTVRSNASDVLEQANVFSMNHQITMLLVSGYANLLSRYGEEFVHFLLAQIENECLYTIRNESEVLLFLTDVSQSEVKEICERMIQAIQSRYQSNVFIAAGNATQTIEHLKNEYEQMLDVLDYKFYVTNSLYIMSDQKTVFQNGKNMLDLYFDRIETEAKLGDVTTVRNEIHKAILYVEKHRGFSSIFVKYSFSEMAKKCCEYLGMEDQIIDVAQKIYMAQSLKEVENAFIGMTKDYISDGNEMRNDDSSQNEKIMMAKNYVINHYASPDLGVSGIADYLGVSAAYLSSYFKKKAGVSLNKYILNYRIDMAKKMLIGTSLKVGEVAKKVGYINTSYFISVFRSSVGCSPQKFREEGR